jgi:hypothetical protein
MAITELDVHAAADALLRDGDRPTIERVRLKLGRGSPNTITGFLNTWFAGLGERLAGARDASLPDPVMRLAQDLWRVALDQAREQARTSQVEEAVRLAAERDRLAAAEEDLSQAQERLQARQADLELGVKALREQLTAAQDAAYSATARLQAEQQQAASAREALMQARGEADTLRAQVVDVQTRQAEALAETQSRHAAQERRWLNELDAERQATKRLTAEIERTRLAAERDRQEAERERQSAERERQAAEQERGESQTAIADLQNELRQALRTETTVRAELAAAVARLDAGQAAIQASDAAAARREADLLRQIQDLSAQLAVRDKQLDTWAQSLAPRRKPASARQA